MTVPSSGSSEEDPTLLAGAADRWSFHHWGPCCRCQHNALRGPQQFLPLWTDTMQLSQFLMFTDTSYLRPPTPLSPSRCPSQSHCRCPGPRTGTSSQAQTQRLHRCMFIACPTAVCLPTPVPAGGHFHSAGSDSCRRPPLLGAGPPLAPAAHETWPAAETPTVAHTLCAGPSASHSPCQCVYLQLPRAMNLHVTGPNSCWPPLPRACLKIVSAAIQMQVNTCLGSWSHP